MNKRTKKILIGIMATMLILESGPVMCMAATDISEEPAADDMAANAVEELVVAYDEDRDEIPLGDVEADYDGFIFKLKDDATRGEIRELEQNIEEKSDEEAASVVEGEYYVADSLETIEEIADSDSIEVIEPDYVATLMDAAGEYVKPNDPFYSNEAWSVEMMKVPEVWERDEFGSNEVTVAVIDSGCDTDNDDLNYSNIAMGYTAWDGFYDDDIMGKVMVDGKETYTNVGHGTAVIGIINALFNNGIGLAGIMPNVKIYSSKVFGWDKEKNKEISATTSDIIKALRDCVENGNADVVNMSFCISGANSLLEEECRNAADKGVILVAASGNSEVREMLYPASFDSVISVGSVDKRGADGSISRSNFSTYNSMVDAVAPGNTMTCLGADGEIYIKRKGTSFSSPEVAALAAMAKSAHKKIDVGAFRRYLSRTCVDLGKTGKDEEYGYGLVDFDAVYGVTRGLTDINECEIDIENTGLVYNGKYKTPDVSVVLNGETLTKDTDYSVSYSNNLKAGENAIARISGIGKYVGSAKAKFVIERADVSGGGLAVSNCTYTGNALKPKVKDTRIGATLVCGTDCMLTYSNNVSLGQASVKIIGKGNYKGTTTKRFDILPGKARIRSPKARTRTIQVNWSRRSDKMRTRSGNYIHVRGYQVQLSKSKTFSSVTKKSVKGYNRTTAKFRGLKRNTRYYMRVRTYVRADGKNYYSYWSDTKTIKTK